MRKKRNQPQQQAKMRVVAWALSHKDVLQGLSIGEAHDLIMKETGADLPGSSVRDVFAAIDLQLKKKKRRERAAGKLPRGNDLRIRVLARALRDLILALGEKVPEPVEMLCRHMSNEEAAELAKDEQQRQPQPAGNGHVNGHKQRLLLDRGL